MGGDGNYVQTTFGGCLKVDDDYPTWWGTSRHMLLQPSEGGAGYPVLVHVTNTCTGLNETLTFDEDWQDVVTAGTTNQNCVTLIDLLGSVNQSVRFVYYGQ